MIAELGVGEDASNSVFKSSWISDAFAKLKNNYPLVKAITWFQYNKESDWRVNSSTSAFNTFKSSNSYFSLPK